ncbi:hypothetical protein G7L40_00950 [Paenibacillus polymyxa]|uniref:Phage protein n=1 Tax=Paenibacillus polymyxa TaxID=1406 RepID=A0A378XWP2_PAEPO|nr:hypothetical protein [Paenibacillus polymyxa]MBE7897278.1 hypothetical protein [Paenibacillus polymyxa]MBG9763122.1 hypothetical protein [Paenibacillus polymyxa]MBG9766424.1 hypothetical protein [Paenibacillus polymyxa]MCC3257473.1 hypothetical protein [Paenibacillus polymyxa]QPK51425.1 hypothetical protein G7035_00945 [Paenibacillus polymyxa]
MIKEAMQYIAALANKEVKEVGGQIYTTGSLELVQEPVTSTLKVNTLSALVTYLMDNYDKLEPVLVHVVSETDVRVLSAFNRDKRRNVMLQASAVLPDINFERYMDVESFNVQLQACFVENLDRAAVLKLVGNVKEESGNTYADDGVSQQVTAKSGVASLEKVTVPNPVKLKPYRTFIDIPQPECSFVFRLQSGPRAALFEADGGAWKLQAMASIKEHLYAELEDEIKSGFVTIIA